jgi:CheY-like chemotaxis protein
MDSGQPCILVADDDRDIIIYLKNVLRALAAETHFVTDGKAALVAARRFLPDLLLLDVGMPVMNGIDVLRSLKRYPSASALVTVMLTGSSDPAHVAACAALGAVDYILKPLDHVDITRKVNGLLAINRGISVSGRLHRIEPRFSASS